MTADELIDYYKNLLIAQYATKTRARATVGAFVGEAVASDIQNQVRGAFDLDTAVGAQLDILGTYIGVSRLVYGLIPGKTFFALPAYADDPDDFYGFAEYADTDEQVTWYYLTYPDLNAAVYTMDDEKYRQVLKYTAKLRSSPMGIADIDDLLMEFFGADIIMTEGGQYFQFAEYADADEDVSSYGFAPYSQADNELDWFFFLYEDSGVMVIQYADIGPTPNELFGLIAQLELLPHPAGVRVLVTT